MSNNFRYLKDAIDGHSHQNDPDLSPHPEEISYSHFVQRIGHFEEIVRKHKQDQFKLIVWENSNTFDQLALLIACGIEEMPLAFIPYGIKREESREIISSLGKAIYLTGESEVVESESRELEGHVFELLLMTSGSTGTPKLVVLSEELLLNNAKNAVQGQGITKNSKVLLHLSLSHSGGLGMQAIASLLAGARVRLLNLFHANEFFKVVKEWKPEFTIILPGQWSQLQRLSSWDKDIFKCFKGILTGSYFFHQSFVNELVDLGADVFHTYGGTEFGPFSFMEKYSSPSSEQLVLGSPVSDIEYKIVDHEMWVRGKTVSKAYVKNGIFCESYNSEGWYQTGDLVWQDEQSKQLYFKGRKGSEVRIIDRVFFPDELIQKLNQKHPHLNMAIKDEAHKSLGRRLEILIENIELSQNEVSQAIRKDLYEVDEYLGRFTRISCVDKIPENRNQKPDPKRSRK